MIQTKWTLGVCLLAFASNSATAGGGMQIQMGTSPAISALNLINGLNDGRLHSANAPCPDGGQSSGTIGAMPQLNAALAGARVSAILDRNDCATDEIALAPSADQALESNSPRAAKIEWRSVSEVIEYLGAIARNQNDPARMPSWDQGQTLFHLNQGGSDRGSAQQRPK
jgi:hypothetical protein